MNDTISRNAAIDAAIEAADEWDGGHNLTRANMIADAINNIAPSAQPERKKGRWLNINESEKWECSECGRMMWFSPRLGVKPSDYRFCPNCGADMRGGQNESD